MSCLTAPPILDSQYGHGVAPHEYTDDGELIVWAEENGPLSLSLTFRLFAPNDPLSIVLQKDNKSVPATKVQVSKHDQVPVTIESNGIVYHLQGETTHEVSLYFFFTVSRSDEGSYEASFNLPQGSIKKTFQLSVWSKFHMMAYMYFCRL